MHHEFVHNKNEFALGSTFSCAISVSHECARSYRGKNIITFPEALPLTTSIGVSVKWSYEQA